MTLLKMFPAKNGDAFLLKEPNPNDAAILVDGGYASTFQEFILPELTAMHASGQALDLVVSTHIDADHISGLIELFRQNREAHSPAVVAIKNVWHNSLRSMTIDRSTNPISAVDHDVLSAIRSRGFPPPGEHSSTSEISARQGSSLAALLLHGRYVWNNGDGRQSVNSSAGQAYNLTPDTRVHVLGPPPERLESLQGQWITELRRLGLVGRIGESEFFDDAFEFLSASEVAHAAVDPEEIAHKSLVDSTLAEAYFPDNSINNGSSITLLIETPSSRMLFLGDAWAEDVERALSMLPSETYPIQFDAIKIAHHGSVRNTSVALLDLIDAPVYLFSSDGARHNHPDLPVLKAIVDRPSKFMRHLHFNYATPASRQLRLHRSSGGAEFVMHEESTGWIKVGKIDND